MKIAHRNPAANWFAVPESAVTDDRYEAKVQQSAHRAERDFQQAEARLRKAEARLTGVMARRPKSASRKQIAQLQELINLRRCELEECRRLMTAPAVSADKQLRQRTGRDDHLELGEYKRPESKEVPAGPVMRLRNLGRSHPKAAPVPDRPRSERSPGR